MTIIKERYNSQIRLNVVWTIVGDGRRIIKMNQE